MECIFCRIVAGQIPCHKIAETAHALAFLDINPLAAGHALIIPKAHAERAHEISAAAMAEIGPLLARVARAVTLNDDGATYCDYNILQNNGAAAHQEVMHAHFHIIPKRSADSGFVFGRWASLTTDHAAFGKHAELLRARVEADAAKE